MYKNYFYEIMRPPEFRGPGSGEPPEPWLIQQVLKYIETFRAAIGLVGPSVHKEAHHNAAKLSDTPTPEC